LARLLLNAELTQDDRIIVVGKRQQLMRLTQDDRIIVVGKPSIKTTKPLRERFIMRQSYDYPQAMPTFILSSDFLIVNI